MTVLTNLAVELDFDEFMEKEGARFHRPAVREMAEWAFTEVPGLIDPALVYDWLPVHIVDKRRAEVGGTVLEIGKHADLLELAVEACVSVVTIGPRVEERVKEYMSTGDGFRGYVLDEVGVFAVGVTGALVHGIVEQEAARRGWGVGAELAPGQLAGWNVKDQKLICGLVDVGAIGVGVTDGAMLLPQKSATVMVGIGPQYEGTEVHSPCDFCDQRSVCTWSH